MCWNKDISLNTFLFSVFALLFIYITNTYTKYKTPAFDNTWVYVVTLLVSSMQLLEYFIWKNIKNREMNFYLSGMGMFLIFLQIAAFTLLADKPYSYYLLFGFLVFAIIVNIYKRLYSPFVLKTTVSKNGHLSWDWLRFPGNEKIIVLVAVFFYLLPLLLMKNPNLSNVFIGVIFFIASYLFLKDDNTYGSMWCWLINLLLLKIVIEILIIQPFYEYNGLC